MDDEASRNLLRCWKPLFLKQARGTIWMWRSDDEFEQLDNLTADKKNLLALGKMYE
jgi:hypothetical protein